MSIKQKYTPPVCVFSDFAGWVVWKFCCCFSFREIQNYKMEEVALHTFKNTHLVGLDNKNLTTELTNSDEAIMCCDLYKDWFQQLQSNEECYRLAIGALIAHRMRLAVKEKTGFSCSAGVGPNKVQYQNLQQTLFICVSLYLD